MKFAVKWMYSVDKQLVIPCDDRLASLMGGEDFRDIVGPDIWRRMDLIRKLGNHAVHTGKKITREQAALCLENHSFFMEFVACCYGETYTEGHFDRTLLERTEPTPAPAPVPDVTLEQLIAENKALKEDLTTRREAQQPAYVPRPLELSEYQARKIYIDAMLLDAGWVEGQTWVNEVELPGMPNKSGVGYADYVLYDGAHRPLAAIYSKWDLEKWFNLQSMHTNLKNVAVDRGIAGRWYQEGAVKAVCDAFGTKNRRKALLAMATGSGKTRTVIALCDVLLRHGWVKNILFLVDRNSLVTQAKRSFVNLLPDLSVTNLCEEKDNYAAHCVFSTYQTMMNCIDAAKDAEGKLFTCGHFDLVICDEAHRSILDLLRK